MYKIINIEKRINSLKFKQRNKTLKALLLEAYGSFEEMALCGVNGSERTGYLVPLSTPYYPNCHNLGTSPMYLESDIEALKLYIDKGMLNKAHVYTHWYPSTTEES